MPTRTRPPQAPHPIDVGEHRTVTVDGTAADYWVYGTQGDTPTLLLIHGLRGTHEGLALIATDLAERGLSVIVPDLPGFANQPDLAGGNTIENYAHWVNRFRQAAGMTEAVVVGHSFGSIIVAAAAAEFESSPVVLINPVALPARRGPHPITARLGGVLYDVAAHAPERVGRWLLTSRIHVRLMSIAMAKTRDRQLRAWIHNQHDTYYSRFASIPGVVRAFHESSEHGVCEFAANLTGPTLLIAADRDDVTKLEDEYALLSRLPNAEIVVLRGVGHLVHYERSTEVGQAIADFARRVVTATG